MMTDGTDCAGRLRATCAMVTPVDARAEAAARARQDMLTKPQGSLGRLEELSIRLAGITGQERPRLGRKVVFTLAGDHGVVAEGVSAYPQAVSAQMVANFLQGGAAVCVLARRAGAEVVVADMGLASEVPGDTTALRKCRVAAGTANMAQGPAMTREQMEQAVCAGLDLVAEQAEQGLALAATGEMGIGNTTPATAILCACSGLDPSEVTGPGTGLDQAGVARKAEVIRRALQINAPAAGDAWEVLRKVGGLEIAGLTGVILGCAARHIPVVVDGFISTSAALVAARACPAATQYMFAGHRSSEPGHDRMLVALGLEPILDLRMRLGEGTGAVLAFGVLEAAAAILDEMATFTDAGVAGKD
jgi:nicotinate-nucleotide--dimethylbenzimidazole phosphoribosyltransferase